MKTKWHLFILWSVLSLGLLSSVANTYESPSTGRKKLFKLGTSKSKPVNLSTTEDTKSSQRTPASTSPLPRLSLRRSYPSSTRVTPRLAHPGKPEARIQSDFAYLPDVSATCSTSDFVVRVKPAFYGLGAHAEELTLGSSCRSNGVLRPYGDMLFTYPLTACGGVRELPHGSILYKFVLHYEPSPNRFPSSAHRVNVHIECRYQRNYHVHQLALQPTWETVVVRKRLKGRQNDFQIKLMDDSWNTPAKSQEYLLGQTVNIQVSAPHLPPGGKLYINSCNATPSSGSKSSLKYTIIDNYGCMIDSKRDPGASQFISRTDKTLRLSLKAFQFTADPDTEVRVHCKLFVTSEAPSPAHKSCTYKGNRWRALTGDDYVCECCESQCVTSKSRRAMMEGSASSKPLLVSDQPYTVEDGFLPVSPSQVSMREDKITTNEFIDKPQSHEKLWESVDGVQYDDGEEEKHQLEASEITPGVMTEPDLVELSFRKRVLEDGWNESEVEDLNEFREDGSAYEEDFSESRVEDRLEERGDEISGVEQTIHLKEKEGEVLHHWVQLGQLLPSEVSLQRTVQPPDSEDEDERVIASEVQGKDSSVADVVDDGEMTWYFTWR